MALYPAPDMRTGAISLWVAGDAEADRAGGIVRELGYSVSGSAMTRFDPSGPLRGPFILRRTSRSAIARRWSPRWGRGDRDRGLPRRRRHEGDPGRPEYARGHRPRARGRRRPGRPRFGSRASGFVAPGSDAGLERCRADRRRERRHLLRMLPGWLAGQGAGSWTLDGDESIRRRPVDRVAEPLQLDGRRGRLPRGQACRRFESRAPTARDRLRVARRKCPGQVVHPDSRPARRWTNPRQRAGPDP